jgi:hypothetical protein
MFTPRVALSAIVALAGLALLTYGMAVHSAPVLVEQEVTPPLEPAVEPPPDPGLPASPFFAQPPPPAPPPVPKKVLVALPQPESRLLRDATVGGLTRLDDGRIKRTYSGDGPALCPT